MNRHIKLLLLQFKSAFRMFPKLIAGTAVFAVLAILIGYAGSRTLSGNENMLFFRIAAVLPDDDPMVNIGFNMLTSIDSLKNYCEFIRTDAVSAEKLLDDGEVYGVVYIPEGFVEDVLDGTNTPAGITLPGNSGFETVLFRSVFNAGSSTLAYAQSGIYAVTDTYIRFGISDQIPAANDALNSRYIKLVLNRSSIFNSEKVSSTGSLSLVQFFVCAGLALLMLFTGFTLNGYALCENANLSAMLRRSGISECYVLVCKTLVITLIYGTLFLLLIFAARAVVPLCLDRMEVMDELFFVPSAVNIGLFLLCCSLSASFILMIFNIAGGGVYGILLLFFGSTIMLFVSGCIIPSAYLPKAAAAIGGFLPTGVMRHLLAGMYTHEVSPAVCFGAAGYVALFTSLSCAARRLK